jgi:Flp pilus assembly protein TadD
LADGNSDRAIPYLRAVAQRFPSGETLTNLGIAYLSSGQLDSATVRLQQALRLDPTSIESMRALGGALIEQERGEDAVPYLTQVAQREQSGDVLGMLSLALAQSHRADEASQAAIAAVTRSPNDPAAFQFAGRAAQTSGKFDDAVRYLSQAMRLDPSDPQTLTRLGIAEASLGRNADAEVLFNRSLKIAPGYERAQRALQQLRSKNR